MTICVLFSSKNSKNGNLAGAIFFDKFHVCQVFQNILLIIIVGIVLHMIGKYSQGWSKPQDLCQSCSFLGQYQNCFVYSTLIVSIFDVFFHSSFCCGHKWDLIRGGLREKLPPLEATAPASLSFVKHKLAAKSRQTSRNIIAKCWKCKRRVNTLRMCFIDVLMC